MEWRRLVAARRRREETAARTAYPRTNPITSPTARTSAGSTLVISCKSLHVLSRLLFLRQGPNGRRKLVDRLSSTTHRMTAVRPPAATWPAGSGRAPPSPGIVPGNAEAREPNSSSAPAPPAEGRGYVCTPDPKSGSGKTKANDMDYNLAAAECHRLFSSMACPVQRDAGDSGERARLRSSPDCQAEDGPFALPLLRTP
jgi:hypothetical protein